MSIKRKLSLLQLAEELGKVARAAKVAQFMGFHRDTCYEVRKAFQRGGVATLVEQRRGTRSHHPSRVSPFSTESS